MELNCILDKDDVQQITKISLFCLNKFLCYYIIMIYNPSKTPRYSRLSPWLFQGVYSKKKKLLIARYIHCMQINVVSM